MADYPDRPGFSFNPGPPPEASRFLSNKGWQPAFSWQDVEPEEHAVAFTVAKAMRMDVLSSIREAVQGALDEGKTLQQFQKELTPELQRLGWWGKGYAPDPASGEMKLAQLGSPRRLRTIYNANLRSARAAGQWDRIQRTKAALPFLTYRLGPSERHRPAHVAQEGVTLPVDHPFWSVWYPPNGWGCKCWVRQISAAEAERLGISEAPMIETYQHVNERTGEMRDRVKGIDVGWEANPGARRLQALQALLDQKLIDAPEAVARTAMRDMATSWRVRRVAAGAPGSVAIGMLPSELLADAPSSDPFVRFTDRSAQHVFSDHRDRSINDLRFAADIAEADRMALVTSAAGLQTLVVETEAAADPAAQDRYSRNPLRFYVHLHQDGNFIGSMHRVARGKFGKLVKRLQARVIK